MARERTVFFHSWTTIPPHQVGNINDRTNSDRPFYWVEFLNNECERGGKRILLFHQGVSQKVGGKKQGNLKGLAKGQPTIWVDWGPKKAELFSLVSVSVSVSVSSSSSTIESWLWWDLGFKGPRPGGF